MAPHVCRGRIVDGIATNSFIERVVWRMQSGVICVVRQIFGCGVWRRKSDTNCINPCRARFVIETVIYRRKLWGPSIFVNRCLWDDMASIKRHVNDANYSELVWIKSLTVWQREKTGVYTISQRCCHLWQNMLPQKCTAAEITALGMSQSTALKESSWSNYSTSTSFQWSFSHSARIGARLPLMPGMCVHSQVSSQGFTFRAVFFVLSQGMFMHLRISDRRWSSSTIVPCCISFPKTSQWTTSHWLKH